MPKLLVIVVTDRWGKGDICDFHHGTVTDSSGSTTEDIEIEAPDAASAIIEAKRASHSDEVIGEPKLIDDSLKK